MKISKYLFFIAVFSLQVQIISANEAEEEMFYANGFSSKHYMLAQRLNLDLENYKNFRLNKSDKIKGAVMIGVGSGIAATGLPYFIVGLVESRWSNSYRSTYDYDYGYRDEDKFIARVLMVSGGVVTATGIGLIVGGVVKRTSLRKVITKDGNKLSLLPRIDTINNLYGAELSISF